MARIRTIKPEICTSEQFDECSTNARLLFVLMWMFCDDAGVHPYSVKRIKMECFPGDNFTGEDVHGMIDELLANGLLVSYTAENKPYLAVTGWHHQKIDRPSYKYPPCPIRRTLDESSDTYRRFLDEHSTNDRDQSPPDRSLPESSLSDTHKEGACDESSKPKKDPPGFDGKDIALIKALDAEWRKGNPKATETKPTASLRHHAQQRLLEHEHAEIVEVFRWCLTSSHPRAANLRDKGILTIHWMLSDGPKGPWLDEYRALMNAPPSVPLKRELTPDEALAETRRKFANRDLRGCNPRRRVGA